MFKLQRKMRPAMTMPRVMKRNQKSRKAKTNSGMGPYQPTFSIAKRLRKVKRRVETLPYHWPRYTFIIDQNHGFSQEVFFPGKSRVKSLTNLKDRRTPMKPLNRIFGKQKSRLNRRKSLDKVKGTRNRKDLVVMKLIFRKG